ncbi:MAG: DEAD/DEAH box helicase [Chlamydiia bacterium]|nr:DEAD/DEAH box helicase [Chlamydiia bacterium]
MDFSALQLAPQILEAVTKSGYNTPTPVQIETIPHVLAGSDVLASAQTGTGKTAAFLLPALHRLTGASGEKKGPRVLILVPTRELALQIATQAEKYSQYLKKLKTVCVVGGVSYHIQKRKLAKPYDILIATPGRLIDLVNQRKINLKGIEMLVLDEADRMLDMGFVDDVETIVAATPENRQTLFFSATMQGSVLKLAKRLLTDPQEVAIHPEKVKHDNIAQVLHFVDNLPHKNRLLTHILDRKERKDVIIFTATKRHADQLTDELKEKGYLAVALHGDLSQRQRTRTILQFKKGKFNVLVATDVAARGIDIQTISHVINFDLPNNVEDYVHRIGRTGRAGAKGTALSFAAPRDTHLVQKIEKFTGHTIPVEEISGLEPLKVKKPAKGPRNNQLRRSSGRFDKRGGVPQKGPKKRFPPAPFPKGKNGRRFKKKATASV